MKRPRLTGAVVQALGALRATAKIELDNGGVEDAEFNARLRCGIEYIDELRAWYRERHPDDADCGDGTR